MKRYVPIVTLSLAILLIGSIAYASDKRKKARPIVQEPAEMSEEALKVELLAATEDQHKTIPEAKTTGSSKSVDVARLKVKLTGQ